jgi:hypothetical protein
MGQFGLVFDGVQCLIPLDSGLIPGVLAWPILVCMQRKVPIGEGFCYG